jgi:uncharacterized membrane protein YgaE (UPF0421/DUF939 family)
MKIILLKHLKDQNGKYMYGFRRLRKLKKEDCYYSQMGSFSRNTSEAYQMISNLNKLILLHKLLNNAFD